MMFEWGLECVPNIACALQESGETERQAVLAPADDAQDFRFVT